MQEIFGQDPVQASLVTCWQSGTFNNLCHRVSQIVTSLLTTSRPTVERTSRLLQKFELRFQKSDESAYSIVPSRISMRIRRNSVAGTENERDISYHRLSFENDLFTARVYKRNYRTRKLRLDTNQLTDCFHSEEMISANGMLSLKHPNDVSIQNDSFMEARYPEDEQGSACFLSSQPPQEPREVNADDAGFADDKDLDLIRGLLPPINSSLGDRPWDLLKRGNLSRYFRSDVITYLRSCAMNDSARAELILPDFWNMDFVFPSAYHFIFTGAMCTAAANGRNDIIEALLSRGALANDVHRYFCKGPLHSAVRGNQFSTVDLLLRGGAEATTPNQDGSTPLHVASQRCWEDIIALLLDSGASIHDRDLKGRQPLHLASLDFDRPQIVSILVRKGANPEALDNDGHSPLHIACIKGRLASAHTLFGLGARKGCYSDFDAVVTSAALSDLPLLVQVLLGHQSEDIWTLINEFFGPKSRRLANLSWRGFKAWYGTYKTMIMVSNLKSTGDL